MFFGSSREVCDLRVGWAPGTIESSFPHPSSARGLADHFLPWCLQTVVSGPLPGQVVAPVSGNSLGVRRAEIKPGVREIHLCKDERGKTGLRLRAIDKVGLGAGRKRRDPSEGAARAGQRPKQPKPPEPREGRAGWGWSGRPQ